MAGIIVFAIEHWIITGWIILIICICISQDQSIIDSAVKSKTNTYDYCINVLGTIIVLWVIISVITFIKFIWFNV